MVRTPLSMEYALLGLIYERAMYGYEIHQLLTQDAGLGLIWRLKQSQLYALLDKLEEDRLVETSLEYQENRPPRKVFRLTDAGRQAFLEWVQTPVPKAHRVRQEFLAKLFFYRLNPNLSPHLLIDRQRETCQAWLVSLKKQSEACRINKPYDGLVFEYRVHQVGAILDWLAECENSLQMYQ